MPSLGRNASPTATKGRCIGSSDRLGLLALYSEEVQKFLPC
jgi:hypothetical protein